MQKTLIPVAAAMLMTLGAGAARATDYDLGDLSTLGTSNTSVRWPSFPTAWRSTFQDVYTFSLDTFSDLKGFAFSVFGWDAAPGGGTIYHQVDTSKVSLYQKSGSGQFTQVGEVYLGAGETYSFASLVAGDYRLSVSGVASNSTITGQSYASSKVAGYDFRVQATAVAPPVPEASDLAMTVLGLAGVAAWRRVRQRAH